MNSTTPRKNKWIAVSIIAFLSTCVSALMQLFSNSMRNSIIEHKHLGEILTQIKETNIDRRALSSVLREQPPLVFVFIATVISVAITVWLYHWIIQRLSNPKRTTCSEKTQSVDERQDQPIEKTFSERIRRYTEQELESSLQAIDKEKHPDNYRLLCAELEKRKTQVK